MKQYLDLCRRIVNEGGGLTSVLASVAFTVINADLGI